MLRRVVHQNSLRSIRGQKSLTELDMHISVSNAANYKQRLTEAEEQRPYRPLYLDAAATTPVRVPTIFPMYLSCSLWIPYDKLTLESWTKCCPSPWATTEIHTLLLMLMAGSLKRLWKKPEKRLPLWSMLIRLKLFSPRERLNRTTWPSRAPHVFMERKRSISSHHRLSISAFLTVADISRLRDSR